MLKEFIQLHGGRLIMVSGSGYLEVTVGGMKTLTLDYPFLAHVVVRTDDSCHYER